jgi:hypothetical protein
MRSSSVTAMMENLKWTPLAERRREQRLILLFKIVNDLVAIPTDDITFNNRPSRNSNNRQIQVLSTNTDIYKNSYFPKTIKDWNNLSDSAVHSFYSFHAFVPRHKLKNEMSGIVIILICFKRIICNETNNKFSLVYRFR